VVLISIDTLRPDRLAAYGATRGLTPRLDAFAREAIIFPRAWSTVPITLPSHAAMLTGLIPPRAGVRDNAGYRLDESRTTLAERLREAGYVCGAFVGSFVLDSRSDIDQGFGVYDDRMPPVRPGAPSGASERRAEEVNRAALEWLQERAGESFFLFVHYYDPHAPYAAPAPFAAAQAKTPYDGEVAYVDHCVGQLLDGLRKHRAYERALVIVTSDHGESLGEHGEAGHGYFVYDATTRVPLLVKPPRGRWPAAAKPGERLDRPASLVDIVPTVLGLLGRPIPEGLDGVDLTAAPAGPEAVPRPLYIESLTPTRFGAAGLYATLSGRYKLVFGTGAELYDLADDPRERTDLAATEGERVAGLHDQLEEIRASAATTEGAAPVAVDAETRERLASLGYLAGGVREDRPGSAPRGVDPRSAIAVHEAFQGVLEACLLRDFHRARALSQELRDRQPDLPDVLLLAGDVEMQAGDPAAAGELYGRFLDETGRREDGIDRGEQVARAWFNLGNARDAGGDREGALAAWRNSLAVLPGGRDARFNLAVTLAGLGRLDEAAGELETLVAADPTDTEANYNLGLARDAQQRPEEADRAYQRVLEADPAHAGALVERARNLLAAGRGEEGLALFRRAVAAHPDRPELANELALILATHEDDRLRDGEEAERLARMLVQATREKQPAYLETLAAAEAEQGEYKEAARLQLKALQLARGAGSARLQTGISQRLELYLRNMPLRLRFRG